MKKLISLALVVVMMLTVSIAFANTLEPEDTDYERLAGVVVHATVGAYDEEAKTLNVTLYEEDRYDIEDVEKLAAGDTLLAGGHVYRVTEVAKDADGSYIVTAENETIVFVPAGDEEMTAMVEENDRKFMHAFAVLSLPVAEGITLEDRSDPDKEEAVVTAGLEDILKIKAEKEANSIGLDFYATTIQLNGDMEIVKICQDFDVAQ